MGMQIFNQPGPKKILCLGAHCDDVEIGCGGTVLEILDSHDDIEVLWVILASTPQRKLEAEKGAERFCSNASKLETVILDFTDGFLPAHWQEVKMELENIKKRYPDPDLIFTHYSSDKHQDHRLVSELTWNTYRNNLILEYEIPKWDGDLSAPNSFVPISEQNAQRKIQILQDVYNSQQNKKWFTDDLFWSMMRIRGMESNSSSNLAEGFYSRKLVLSAQ